MPYHTMTKSDKKAVDKVKANSIEKKVAGNKKRKPKRIFEKKPPNSHAMPDGTIMSGSKHSASSKPLGKMKAKPKAKMAGKGSKAMKDKMAKLRAMRKKK